MNVVRYADERKLKVSRCKCPLCKDKSKKKTFRGIHLQHWCCKDSNVVYAIRCRHKRCTRVYIGQTMQTSRKRFYVHRSATRLRPLKSTSISRHLHNHGLREMSGNIEVMVLHTDVTSEDDRKHKGLAATKIFNNKSLNVKILREDPAELLLLKRLFYGSFFCASLNISSPISEVN